MTWSRRFQLRQTARGSLWIVPLAGAVLGGGLGALVSWIDTHLSMPGYWDYPPATATAVLTAIVGATAALTGFVVTVTVLFVQMAAGTFSARYMRIWYRDGLLKITLAALVGTLTFSFALLRRVESSFVPDLGVTIAGALLSASLLLFLLFFSRFIQRLRPVAVAAHMADAGRRAFAESVRYADRPDIRWGHEGTASGSGRVVPAPRAGAIQALDLDGLVKWAKTHRSELVFVRAVGDFVSTGTPLLQVHGPSGDAEAEDEEIVGMIALGDERTIEQDPAFAIRVLVDVAIRALSPAVNDPTTAVQVLNHMGELLRLIGTTDLGKRALPTDAETTPSLVVLARGWEDALELGVTEIREYGATSVQVLRRLRKLLEELRDTVLPEHRAAVERELARLDATVVAEWRGSVDHDLALVADGQGIGGPGTARRA